MTNHFHLIVSSGTNSLEHVMRDLKKHTSKRLVRTIKENSESRRVWMLKKFEYAAKRIKRGVYYKIWQDGFHPVELTTNKMIDERMEYLHNNPVKEGIVWRPEDYVYSSASYYCGLDYLMEIDPVN